MSTTNRPATLREIADGVFAYLQHGSWGFSNAGLVTDAGQSLLVDTLYDLRLTADMLLAMRRESPAAAEIDVLVNTHANGDHCWGNQLVGEARIVSSAAAAHEMLELSPRLMHTLVRTARAVSGFGPIAQRLLGLLGRLGVKRASSFNDAASFIVDSFGRFEFGEITLEPPSETFTDQLDLQVGDKRASLIEVGPAHTKGDVIVHLREQRVAFTGDILFIGSHPIIWEGPVSNWVAACDRLLALDVDVFVPGHGPITDKQGVQATKDYFEQLIALTTRGHAAGLTAREIAAELRSERFHDWNEPERVVVNIDTIYRELQQDRSPRDPISMLAAMGRWQAELAPLMAAE